VSLYRSVAIIEVSHKGGSTVFEDANDREEYYHFLAEEIHGIQKKLQETRENR
jgi:hypothetical protein